LKTFIFFLQHPGNIAVDGVNGGRLIFYDFGMMGRYFLYLTLLTNFDVPKKWRLHFSYAIMASCRISANIREGLLEAFYGIYEKNPDKVFLAL